MARKYAIFIIFFIFFYLFTGVYKDDEFNEKYFFIKNLPTWKWYFYSPRYSSDLRLENMSEIERYEQEMYDQYVSSKLLSIPITIYW